MNISYKNIYQSEPKADSKAIIQGDKYRFTVLTSRLIRMEYSSNGVFEDRATQVVINRQLAVPNFGVWESEHLLIIKTEDIELTYTKQPFSKESLNVKYIGKNIGYRNVWHYGQKYYENLKGTVRTLDGVDGECELEDGLITSGEMYVLDDSASCVITDDGWIAARENDCNDIYLFAYHNPDGSRYDYQGCLNAFYELTGKPPLLPRFVFGNWWSRYHKYTQEEYLSLMERFKNEDIPFSVAVIDMDWHLTDVGPKYCNGWTGYTWNEQLFPNHVEFLKALHNEGMKISLNLHPHEGIAAHEKMYPEMAKAMGIDPQSEKTVEFDIADKKFAENYLKIMHHPLEKEGVDFWWMDWQHGSESKIKGLDPLWMLNHLHYLDNAKDGKRPLILSRYSGPGSHRYPLGFSGDTVISWASLAFQPYFTANSANIGYGYWSHDIGGHMRGYRDEELTARWVQYGVFSPINRLHSDPNIFMGKEPWNFNAIVEKSMKKFLKLRHEMIPYLYSMNYRTNKYGEQLIQPMYYKWGKDSESYNCRTEYSFGTEMIVSPIVSPADSVTCMGNSKMYIPEGTWYDFFTGRKYSGGKTIKMYRDLYEMPILVKAGGIVPTAKLEYINDVENPKTLILKVYAGADSEFEMYEDDDNEKCAITQFTLKWGKNPKLIASVRGDKSIIPGDREYVIEFYGIENIKYSISKCTHSYDAESNSITIGEALDFELELNEFKLSENDTANWIYEVLLHTEGDNVEKERIYNYLVSGKSKAAKTAYIVNLDVDDNLKAALSEAVNAVDAGH